MLIKDRDCLINIVEAIEKIKNYTNSFDSAESFYEDSKSFDAVLMNFVVIGEMVSKLSDEFIKSYSEIEWWKIKGLRNIVAHDYFGVDAEEVWQIIHKHLYILEKYIQKIIKQ